MFSTSIHPSSRLTVASTHNPLQGYKNLLVAGAMDLPVLISLEQLLMLLTTFYTPLPFVVCLFLHVTVTKANIYKLSLYSWPWKRSCKLSQSEISTPSMNTPWEKERLLLTPHSLLPKFFYWFFGLRQVYQLPFPAAYLEQMMWNWVSEGENLEALTIGPNLEKEWGFRGIS